MKKIVHLSFLTTLGLGAILSMASCGNVSVPEHEHTWDSGVVQKEAKCYEEGTLLYSCTVKNCKQTKTTAISKTEHNWGEPETISLPTCQKAGKYKKACTNEGCDAIKEYDGDKGDHSYGEFVITTPEDLLEKGIKTATCQNCEETKEEAVDAEANYFRQFGNDNWEYGEVTSFNPDEKINFVKGSLSEGVYSNDGYSISKEEITSNKNAAIAYHFSQDNVTTTEIIASVSFEGKTDDSILNAHLIYVDKDGNTKGTVTTLNVNGTKTFNVTTEATEVTKDDTVYLVFSNVGTGAPAGAFSYSLKAKCVHVYNEGTTTKEPTETEDGTFTRTCISCGKENITVLPKTGKEEPQLIEFANYHDDFSLEGNNGWLYGLATNYVWADDSFTFEPLTAGEWGYVKDDKVEVKNDWFKSDDNEMVAIGYTIPSNISKVNVAINFWGSEEADPRYSTRVFVLDKDGNKKSFNFIGEGTQAKDWNKTLTLDVSKDDVVFVTFNNESGWRQGSFNIKFSRNIVANYHDDFSLEGNNGWLYGLATNYVWGDDSFTFEPLTAGEWGYVKDDKVEVKNDWFKSDDNEMVAVGYVIPCNATKVNVAINFWGSEEADPRYSTRVFVLDKDGNKKSFNFIGEGTQAKDWNKTLTLDVSKDDVVFVTFNNESGWRQGSFNINITNA